MMKCKICGKDYVKSKKMTEKFSMQGKNRIRDRIIDICFPVQVAGKSRRGMTQERFSEFIADKSSEEKWKKIVLEKLK